MNKEQITRDLMIVARSRGGLALQAFRVRIPGPGGHQYRNQLSSREAFRKNERARSSKGAQVTYHVHSDPEGDYESWQGAWERMILKNEGYEVPRSDDPAKIRIHNALLDYPTVDDIQTFYLKIGYNKDKKTFAKTSFAHRMDTDAEFCEQTVRAAYREAHQNLCVRPSDS